MAAKVPSKVYQSVFARPGEGMWPTSPTSPFESTLPPEGRPKGGRVVPQTYPLGQRLAELMGLNLRPVNREAYERALE